MCTRWIFHSHWTELNATVDHIISMTIAFPVIFKFCQFSQVIWNFAETKSKTTNITYFQKRLFYLQRFALSIIKLFQKLFYLELFEVINCKTCFSKSLIMRKAKRCKWNINYSHFNYSQFRKFIIQKHFYLVTKFWLALKLTNSEESLMPKILQRNE